MTEFLNKWSVRVGLGTLIVMMFVVYNASGKVQSFINQVEDNTTQLAGVVKSLELSRVDRLIASDQADIRELARYLQKDPANELLIKQKSELEASVLKLRAIRVCVVEDKKVCE